VRSVHRAGLASALLAILLGACQGGVASSGSVAAAQPSVASAQPSGASAQPSGASAAPSSIERPTDIPTDGSCEPNQICLGLLKPGLYHSKVFSPGFSFAIAKSGWENRQQESRVYQLLPIDHPGDVLGLFRDPRALDEAGVTISPAVGPDVASLTSWFTSRPSLQVSPPVNIKIGGLSGSWFDVAIAPGATSNDPRCPVAVCRNLLVDGNLADPNKRWNWGLAGPEKMRLYLLSAKGGVVAIIADSLDGTTFEDLTQRASEIIASIKFD
jgi:hypothetical protein